VSFLRAADTGAVVAQVLERGSWNVEDGSLAAALADFAGRHGLADDRVYFILPRHEAAVRILELPSQDPEELRGMVHLGAEEIVPFPLDELLTSFCVLENLEGGSSRVLAVVVRKAVIEAWLDILRGAKLDSEQILLSTACLLTALKKSGPGASCAAIHVAPDGLEVAILRDGRMSFGRGIGLSVTEESGRPSASSLAEIVAEVRNSFSASRRESSDGAAPAELVVSVDGFDAAAVSAALNAGLGMPARPYGGHGLASLVAAGALATAQGDSTYAVELLPETEQRRRASKTSRSRRLRSAAGLLVAVLAMGTVYAQAVMQRRAYLRELDARAEQLRPLAQTLRTKRQQLDLIQEQVHRAASPIALLATVASLAPDAGLNITRFAYDQAQGVTFNGGAVDPKLFDGLIDAMRGPGASVIPQLARAQELYRAAGVEQGQGVWGFAVTIPFAEAPAHD
jgi:type II secretory pathway component PulL